MIELGQLDQAQAEFASRNARLVVASIEGPELATKTQAQFPHLLVLSDEKRSLIDAAGLLHNAASTAGKDSAAPTTFLIDRQGLVRWVFRPDRHVERLSATELVAAVDKYLP